ncbi:MAG: DMT family transporter [Rhodospirillaceae bacterium]|jgi:drug/metabolite transporter (DMT)-like permease|nr:DMT family transporter [Rhodospirillaceae bacterium]MBT6117543.1 DMT family transporter [Rhodospirillaceae bacterium]
MASGEEARPDRTALGIVIILGSVLIMAFADAVVKLVSADLTLWQIFVARSLVAIPIMIALVRAAGVGLKPRAPIWALVRSLLLVLTWIAFYASLPVLSLSVAAVAIYTNPIMTALLAAALIGEPVGRRQWAGVLLGFLGVIAILKPGSDAFSWFTLLPLLGAAFYACAMVLTRSKCRAESPLILVLGLHGSFLATGLIATAALALIGLGAETKAAFPFLFGAWAPMGLREWGLMALIAALSVAFFVGAARAYQIAPPPIIATFDYGYVVSATLWGFVFFAETPDLSTIGGMILIVAAGLLVSAPSSKKAPNDTPAG